MRLVIFLIKLKFKKPTQSKVIHTHIYTGERFKERTESCFYPTPSKQLISNGTYYIYYDETYFNRQATYIEVITGQIPLLNQRLALVKGDINTSVFMAELSYVNSTMFYFFSQIYDKPNYN